MDDDKIKVDEEERAKAERARIIGACVAGLLQSMEELKRDIVASHDEDCLCQFCMDAFYFG